MSSRAAGSADETGGSQPLMATVVVATRNRASHLARLLASLADQRGVRFEVLVVDDDSGDSTSAVLRKGAYDLDIRMLRIRPSRGPGGARNVGWRAARSELVAFIDDDCVAEPGWLAGLVAAHRVRPWALIQGRTVPDPDDSANRSAWARTQSVERLGPYFQTCNIAYPREVLEEVEGFDPAFPSTGEDTDLAWRARKAGVDAVFAPDAEVRHAIHRLQPLDLVRRSQQWADTVGLVKRHPHLRREYFVHRIFWRPSHKHVLRALLGVLLAGRTRGLSLALVAPYVRFSRARHEGYASTLIALPAHVVVDLAEVVAMVRGSVRFRTLAL